MIVICAFLTVRPASLVARSGTFEKLAFRLLPSAKQTLEQGRSIPQLTRFGQSQGWINQIGS